MAANLKGCSRRKTEVKGCDRIGTAYAVKRQRLLGQQLFPLLPFLPPPLYFFRQEACGMNILAIGDIVGSAGRRMISFNLERIAEQYDIDLTIANAENCTHGRGMSHACYNELSYLGIDGFTMGNHTWGCRDVIQIMQRNKNVIRPANFPADCPGRGSMIIEAKNGALVGVVNIIGRVFMDPSDSPFEAASREIEALKRKTDIILVDFHAETTSEKMAMGWYLDGRVSAVFGTHTHVQTSDEFIMPKGTGYITDLGMTGPIYSVLGMNRRIIVDRFLTNMPQKFEIADGRSMLCGCVFEINDAGKCTGVKRINIREEREEK